MLVEVEDDQLYVGQFVHTEAAASEYVPLTQFRHEVRVDPGRERYLPATHKVHISVDVVDLWVPARQL